MIFHMLPPAPTAAKNTCSNSNMSSPKYKIQTLFRIYVLRKLLSDSHDYWKKKKKNVCNGGIGKLKVFWYNIFFPSFWIKAVMRLRSFDFRSFLFQPIRNDLQIMLNMSFWAAL